MVCTLTKAEIKQDEIGGTQRMFEGDKKSIKIARKLPSRDRTLPRCMASLGFPVLLSPSRHYSRSALTL
jgi:hypothetical protein